ncbi:hypothetical protein OUZ56_028140 [Daphnia magna]|uniref:Uncharacterized protein n=1 Tax=Daphnia magna TaxID=35525 RepID=A0ABR0B2Z5_9CRUS|nr:hypothetical protein OUZ56_028140 [Daphnia magna]
MPRCFSINVRKKKSFIPFSTFHEPNIVSLLFFLPPVSDKKKIFLFLRDWQEKLDGVSERESERHRSSVYRCAIRLAASSWLHKKKNRLKEWPGLRTECREENV